MLDGQKCVCVLHGTDYYRNRDSSVSIVTWPLAGRPGFDSRKVQGFLSLFHRDQTGSGIHPPTYPVGAAGSFPGVKAAGA
jgi:hypothetical protein